MITMTADIIAIRTRTGAAVVATIHPLPLPVAAKFLSVASIVDCVTSVTSGTE